jgi:hypothetical protein
MLLGIAAAAALATAPDGARLHEDQACYAIYAPQGGQEKVIGATWQVIRRDQVAGRPVWRIVVHQRLAGGRFDLRDAFVLDARTLRPLSLETTRNGAPHAALTYADDRVSGFRIDDTGVRHAIDQPLQAPVWEGDLFGPTFAALPLAQGESFELPYFQYDRGLGAFTVKVKGSEKVETPDGVVDAWVLDAGPSRTERLDYLIAKSTGRELGYRAPQGGQRLGGDCSGLD